MIGRIVKGVGGFYEVCSGEEIFTLKARGRFRIRGGKPVIGDVVEFEEDGGMILKIAPRKNEFIRPAVANMSQVGIVFAPEQPAPDLLLVDRLLVQAASAGIDIFVALNKCELAGAPVLEDLGGQYHLYDFLACSTYQEVGIAEFREKLRGQDTFLAGQSGVGKSSLVNAAFPGFEAQVGEVSQRLERGKHTTRHVEILSLPQGQGTIVDTPGFSNFEIQLEDLDIEKYYREFDPFRERCRFGGCSHTHEPGCAVKERLGDGVNEKRYQRYVILYQEQMERRKRQYD